MPTEEGHKIWCEGITKMIKNIENELVQGTSSIKPRGLFSGTMESCWLIRFKDGHRMIISEELYKQEVARDWSGRARLVEEHWFDIKKCREKNQGIHYYGFSM